KHVYCEAPLAHTVEDAQAIARAGQSAKTVFQAGLQNRVNPLHRHVLSFVRTGVLGKSTAQARLQFHKKMSWRRASADPEREKRINWHLDKALSLGLVGEIGIHQVDVATWYLKNPPVSVLGFGGVMRWTDGRAVPDTVQCVFEYPNQVRALFDATLVNSFEGSYTLFMGDENAVLVRDQRAWMFREADAPLLGWEVYAKKDKIGDEMGIALVADATRLLQMGKEPGKEADKIDAGKDALYYALEDFTRCIRENQKPACGPLGGLQATVVAIKANEAIYSGSKVIFQPQWFQVG
ncbi:MAG: Gfo/Idh/MocA family oxidoreductase, partial [Armatimonadetes bacterium]|nr:Gfo/Idh/MocA family oxidoreductase [Armatimonadota bacterium]